MIRDYKPMMLAHDAKITRRKDVLTNCAKVAIVAATVAYLILGNL